MRDNIPQVVNINTKEFFRKTMILTSYEDFAALVAETIAQADEPNILADTVKRHLTTAST
jgi:hypothetical protein